jgi:hypothetical protein
LRAALVASCLRGALPPVDLRAVCLVRAYRSKGERQGRGRTVRKLCCMASEIVLLMLLLLLLPTHSNLLQGGRGVQITRRSLRLKRRPVCPNKGQTTAQTVSTV